MAKEYGEKKAGADAPRDDRCDLEERCPAKKKKETKRYPQKVHFSEKWENFVPLE